MNTSSPVPPDVGTTAGSDAQNDTPLPDRVKQPKPKKEKTVRPKKDADSKPAATKPKNKTEAPSKPTPTDPDAMFKVGFLADVYNERPAEKVVTRCMFPIYESHTVCKGTDKIAGV